MAMNDERLKQILSNYKVPDVQPEQIDLVCQKAGAVLKRKMPTRSFSILAQMKVQATYLTKWFYISCGLLALLCLTISVIASMESTGSIIAVFFGISPLFILPCVIVFYQTIANGMLELEAASKYSMTKLFLGKLLTLGAVVSALLLITSIIGGVLTGSTIRPVLLAFLSFTATATVVLWFGKRSMKRGLVCGAVWGVASIAISVWDKGQMFFETVNSLFIWLAFFVAIAFACLAAIRFVRNISFEGVCEGWNSLLTA
jgi:hypothetical protein